MDPHGLHCARKSPISKVTVEFQLQDSEGRNTFSRPLPCRVARWNCHIPILVDCRRRGQAISHFRLPQGSSHPRCFRHFTHLSLSPSLPHSLTHSHSLTLSLSPFIYSCCLLPPSPPSLSPRMHTRSSQSYFPDVSPSHSSSSFPSSPTLVIPPHCTRAGDSRSLKP